MVKLNNLANYEVPNFESPEFIAELHGGRDRRSGVTACMDSKHALTLPFVKSSVDIQPGGRLRTPLGRIDMEVGEFNPLFAILHHGSVILCSSRSKWVAWMKEAHAAGALIIAQDSIEGFQVATIFLGIDFNEGGIGPPLWFETVVFRRSTDGSLGFQTKSDAFQYRTAVDAFVGHVAVCQEVRNGEFGE